VKLVICIAMILASANSLAIRNGTYTTRSEFNHPNLVKISLGGSTCSGTRIAYNYVLTAAHCFRKKAKSGRRGSATTPRIKKFKVSYQNGSMAIQEKNLYTSNVIFLSERHDQELALIKISPQIGNPKSFTAPKIYQYIEGEFTAGDKFIILGYGTNEKTESSIGSLKKGTVQYSESDFKNQKNNDLTEAIKTESIKIDVRRIPKECAAIKKRYWRARRRCIAQYNLAQDNLETEVEDRPEITPVVEATKPEPIEPPAAVQAQVNQLPFREIDNVKFEMLVMKPLKRNLLESRVIPFPENYRPRRDERPRVENIYEALELGEYENQLACPGDSGGPVFKQQSDGELLLVGMVSFISVPTSSKDRTAQQYCADGISSSYIPISLHADFLRRFGIKI
jgi:V8-like Glu-specific endopeptidase